ncbi:MAG: hypothetical protein Q7U98_11090 [Methylicorpusculum sp.]|uniref:hypothetical protein n=1 Tax=Methylicorpusculum sp. TaxID=2713644 RepID=UPI00271731F9|nr:hypothetical protein [Methylicorpusculum sp.]MDO8844380.1 hypothetical protein [Methylicorpusculum sp.]MDO8939694.1 hypothetical protein [Methylicorpusculum sp.]MDO9239661.1 hypothetical protein [Methylicorpusculum sp.]MDP2201620.1 hypothetical protein [Methylicorpusculum sp.]
MATLRSNSFCTISLMAISLLCCGAALADEQEDMQKRLNEMVKEQPFNVADNAKLEAYIEEATKNGTPPVSTPSKYWRRGYTCGDLRRYSWNDYRDCSYFHRYNGYYWPY